MGVIDKLKQEKDLPVVLADQQGLITFVNSAFEKFFGWEADEIIGKPITTLMPATFHDAHNLGFSRFLSTEQPTLLNKPLELNAVKKNGEEFKSIHIIVSEKINDQWVFGATIQPNISEK